MGTQLPTQAPLRTARNSLTSELILDASERVIAKGLDLAMREVARELACTPMAIYKHFQDKQELLRALLDRVISRVEIPERSDTPQDDLRILATNHFLMLQKHSWAIPLLFANPAPGAATNAIGEAFFETLARSGITSQMAVTAFATLLAFNYGWAGFSSALDPAGRNLSQRMPLVVDALPESAEHTKALGVQLAEIATQDNYRAALENLLLCLNG